MTPTNAKIRAVLLDVDGTLLDSNDQHARAWVDALREHGIERSYAEVRPLIGMGGDKLVPRLNLGQTRRTRGAAAAGWLARSAAATH